MPRNINPAIIVTALPIFVEFMRRDGFDVEMATEEFARIAPSPSRGSYLTGHEYNMVSRVGANFTMNRATRIGVYGSFENALNHAAVEMEISA